MKSKGGLRNRLVQVLVKDPVPLMYHGEVLFRDGVCVGDVRAASYGHTLKGAVGLGMVNVPPADALKGVVVNKEYLSSGVWEVDIAGKRYPCVASLTPMYDPKNIQIKS
jgi:glycine cleavage system aminomethyltransferase T